jgi:hypothetical protein
MAPKPNRGRAADTAAMLGWGYPVNQSINAAGLGVTDPVPNRPAGGVPGLIGARPVGGPMASSPSTGHVAGAAGFQQTRMYPTAGPAAQQPTGPAMPTMPAVPAATGFDKSSSYNWSRNVLPKGAEAEIRENMGEQRRLVGVQSDAEQGLAAALKGAKKAELDAKVKSAEDFDRQRKDVQVALAPQEAELLSLTKAVKEGKVDPNRFWSNQTTGQAFATTLGAMLGAFTEGWTGGRVRNSALAVIERAIDRDIQAQRANLERDRAALGAQRGLVSYYYSKLGDLDRAQGLARVALTDLAQVEAQKAEQMYAGTIKGARAKLLQAQLEGAKMMQLAQMKSKRVGGSVTKTPKKAAAGADPLDRMMKMARLRQAMQKAGLAKRPLSEKETNSLGTGTTAMEKWSDFALRVWDEKMKTGWKAPDVAPDLAEFAYSKIPGTKGGAIYRELMTHAMAATRELSGAQASVIETEAQRLQQPHPIDSKAALQFKIRKFFEERLRNVTGMRQAKARFADVSSYDDALMRLIKKAKRVGQQTEQAGEMNQMINGILQGR